MDFVIRVASGDACHVADVPVIHSNQIIKCPIVPGFHLFGLMALTADACLAQFFPGALVGAVSNLLCGGGG